MKCDYKKAGEKQKVSSVCDHLGNKWLNYIEALTAISLHEALGWGRKRIGDMFDGANDLLDEYMSKYAGEKEDVWETTLTTNFCLERELLEIGVDYYGMCKAIPIQDTFGNFWRTKEDRDKHTFRLQWIETMEKKLFVYYGVLFLWLNEKHGYGSFRLARLHSCIRNRYAYFAELYLLCKEKHDRELARMIDEAVDEANRICGETEAKREHMTVEDFIKNKNVYMGGTV